MDDEPMWAVDHVVVPTPGSVITIPETANEFSIKGGCGEMKAMMRMAMVRRQRQGDGDGVDPWWGGGGMA
nr:hypothetical protein [Tanacetum cinerariifolium]